MVTHALTEEQVALCSDGLALEARLAYPDDGLLQGRVLLCPPHPFLGGDMDNNVVRALSAWLASAGFSVLRFNYRGIGASASARDLGEDQAAFWQHSTCPRYEAEITRDCAAAFAALPKLIPGAEAPILIGYSFGALPALSMAQHTPLSALVLIAPPVARWPLEFAHLRLPCPRLMVFAPDDFACPADHMRLLQQQAGEGCVLEEIPDADHFFIGREDALCQCITGFLARP